MNEKNFYFSTLTYIQTFLFYHSLLANWEMSKYMNVYECKCRRQPPLFIIKRKPKENKNFSAKTRAITEVASTKKGIQKKNNDFNNII